MSAYTYETNCGQYVLHVDGRPTTAPVDEISIAIDVVEGARLRIGDPVSVQKWADKHRAKWTEAGFPEKADDVKVITGRFTLEDLNRCLSTTGYDFAMYQRLLKGELAQLPLFPPTTPRSPGPEASGPHFTATPPAVAPARRYPRPR